MSVASITDPDQYAALEQQIREFGQIPDQLFTEPHPSKKVQVWNLFNVHCIIIKLTHKVSQAI